MPLKPSVMVRLNVPSPRAHFIFDHILGRQLGFDIRYIVTDEEENGWNGPRIRYGGIPDEDVLFFPSSRILEETGLDPSFPAEVMTSNGPALFPVEGGPMPFDPFAAAFFLLSRYEEYLPFNPDKLGRFPSTASILHRMGALGIPLVDRWTLELGHILEQRFPGLVPRKPGFSFVPSYDIDVAYAYRGRPLWRIAGALARSGFTGDFKGMVRQLKVLLGQARDPYDVYDELIDMHQRYRLIPHWFILAGKRGKRDHNLDPMNPGMRALLDKLAGNGELGLHPSFASNGAPERIIKEKEVLEKAAGIDLKHSRQHFLMLRFPDTYRRLIAAGFSDDFTMGYADAPGFRAGTTRPFPFYDLEEERETTLMIHPFAMMDGTLCEYQGLSPDEARESIRNLIETVREVQGIFCSLWHNSSLTGAGHWKGWKAVYCELVADAVKP